MRRDYKRGAYIMTHIDELNLLIDKASGIAGSDAKLAVLIGSHAQTVSNWRHGKSCPPEMQALMAHVAGLDPLAELARATVKKFEGDKKGDLLMRALGKASLATGAALAGVGANAQAIFSTIQTTGALERLAHWIRQTMCTTVKPQTQRGLCQAKFA